MANETGFTTMAAAKSDPLKFEPRCARPTV